MSAAPDPALVELLDQVGLTRDGVAELLATATDRMAAEVAAVRDEHAAGTAIPEVDAGEVVAGRVSNDLRGRIERRGCAVVRGTFPVELAERWDRSVGDYLERNRFEALREERYADVVGHSKIWGVYWSKPQVEARQHASMAAVRRFLNSFWRHESAGRVWMDPDRDIGYPDRLRRRAPGVPARGLPPHSDAVSSGGWRLRENQRVFRSVLAGDFDAYDPWDAAHRTTSEQEPAALSSVFRTFQGWTALSEMRPVDGVLHLIPIPTAAAYMLVRGVAGELGLLDGEPAPAPARFGADDLLLAALVPIPTVRPGDTVWWHGDVIHSVADASNDERWGNVLYIGVAPGCDRNDAYQGSMFDRFVAGRSPVDFPGEDFEVDFADRAGPDDLDVVGRRLFGLDATVG